jgi:hypothetical protein
MKEILGSLFEPIKPLIDTFADNLPMLIGVVLAVVATIFVVVRATVVGSERWKRNGWKYSGTRPRWQAKRFWELYPRTWFALQPVHLHKAQSKLLTSPGVREFYSPAAGHMEDKKEKGIYLPDGWTCPYWKAITVTMDENRTARRGKHFKARTQIMAVARVAKVLPLPGDVFIGGDRSKHMLVELMLNKHRRGEVLRLMDNVAAVFDAESFEEHVTEKYDRVSMLVHLVKPEDVLVDRKFGVEFFEENQATTPYSIPLAQREDGKVWCLDMHHTLIYGMTGSGKGGPIQGLIRQFAPFVKEGRVQLYGIDPKGPELGAYAKKGVHMFERISIGLAEENIRQHVKTINTIAAIVAERGNNIDPDFRVGQEDLKRDFPATKETPWVVLFIDEYLTLVKGLKKLGKEGAPALATLDQILATGRSFGVYVILATQVATKEVFGDVRDNVPNAIVLKHKASDYWTQEFLGDDAIELGHNPKTKIGPSNKANGYKTAGIGYVSTAEGVVRVRFGYLSDKDIVAVARQFMEPGADESVFDEPIAVFDPRKYGLAISQEEADAMDGVLDDDDGNFGITEEPAAETDDFLLALDDFTKGKGGRKN